MKILINQETYSEKFLCLTGAIQNSESVELGFINGPLTTDAIFSFQPNLILHNSPHLREKLNLQKIPNVLFTNEKVSGQNCVDMVSVGPCVDVQLFQDVQTKERYECDLVFFGDIGVFDEELLEYAGGDHRLRIFNSMAINIPYYCGDLIKTEHPHCYRSAKCSPFSIKEDRSRLYEIILSGGVAAIYDPSSPESFHRDVSRVLSGQKVSVDVEKSEIMSCFNTVKMGKILRRLGFEELGKYVESTKHDIDF